MSQRAVLNLCHLRALLHLDSLAGKRLVGGQRDLQNLGRFRTDSTSETEGKQLAWYNSLASFSWPT
jgi:hypothetical protein